MKTVWKYPIDIQETVDPVLEIPGGGKFLTLKDQKYDERGIENNPFKKKIVDTWWGVDTDAPLVKVQLYIRGTGLEVPPSANYIGTSFPIPGLVLHFFQKDPVFEELEIVNGVFIPKSQ